MAKDATKKAFRSQESPIFKGEPKFLTTTQSISSKLEISMIALFDQHIFLFFFSENIRVSTLFYDSEHS